MITVLLADDEPMIRAGLRAILESDPTIEVVAEAGNGHEAVAKIISRPPDIALLDIRMPGLDGIGAAAEISRVAPEVAVAIVTTFGEDAYIAGALEHGAHGFLLKSGDPRELLAGVHAVAAGGSYFSPSIADRISSQLQGGGFGRASRAQQLIQPLTGREREVLALLGEGLSNAQIARRLRVVEGTVKGHISAILGRLGLDNRVQAALLAHEAGLVHVRSR